MQTRHMCIWVWFMVHFVYNIGTDMQWRQACKPEAWYPPQGRNSTWNTHIENPMGIMTSR
jgi:hypothetical protein